MPEEFDDVIKFFPNYPIITFIRKGYPQKRVAKKGSFFEETRIQKDVIVVGYSWGNIPALKFAAKNPKYVKGLIMISPYLYSKNNFLRNFLIKLPILSDFIFLLSGKNVIKTMLKKSSFPFSAPSSYKRLANKLSRPQVLKAAISEKSNNLLKEEVLKDIASYKIPVALIWGGKDLTSKENKQIAPIYRFIKPALEKRLSDGGHAILFTHPEALADFIKSFIKIINKEL